MACELALYQGVARGDQNSCHSGYRDRELKTVAAADPTWAPKAIATIRSLADTLEDRSIIVTTQRKK
jgi:hypothetical protein